MHFSTISIPDTPGEFTIDFLTLFAETGKLVDIERKWTAVKKYALLVDRCHSEALTGVRSFLGQQSNKSPSNEAELDDLLLASMELEALSDSDSFLVKSLILLLLVSFNEFGYKAIHRFVQPSVTPPERSAVRWMIDQLQADGVMGQPSPNFEAKFGRYIIPVRNNFAHGDWAALEKQLHTLNLSEAFLAVAAEFVAIRQNLLDRGHDV